MTFHNVSAAFGLTIFAGLSTGIRTATAFFARRTSTQYSCNGVKSVIVCIDKK